MPAKKAPKKPVKPAAKPKTAKIAAPVRNKNRQTAKPPVSVKPKPRGNDRQKTAAAPVPAPAAAAKPAAGPDPRDQYNAFAKATQLFHKRQFGPAREWFLKAKEGPAKQIAANADLHIRMCDRRLEASAPAPRTAEELYTYGIALINSRNLGEARKHLESALRLAPGADHVHYALGVCLGLSGDLDGAYHSLQRAIELEPRNRMLARQDSDLEDFSRRPPIHQLLYPMG